MNVHLRIKVFQDGALIGQVTRWVGEGPYDGPLNPSSSGVTIRAEVLEVEDPDE